MRSALSTAMAAAAATTNVQREIIDISRDESDVVEESEGEESSAAAAAAKLSGRTFPHFDSHETLSDERERNKENRDNLGKSSRRKAWKSMAGAVANEIGPSTTEEASKWHEGTKMMVEVVEESNNRNINNHKARGSAKMAIESATRAGTTTAKAKADSRRTHRCTIRDDSGREVIEINDSDSESEDLERNQKKNDREKRTIIDLSREDEDGRESLWESLPRRSRKRAKRTSTAAAASIATAGPLERTARGARDEDGAVWERLRRILDDPRCSDHPAGPSPRENELLSRVSEFGIVPYRYEVPLGNGVSDCVGHDENGRLCVVEAKCIGWKSTTGIRSRRAKVVEQTTAYATFLSQETKSDVAAYSFDDQNGMVALQSFGIFEYNKVKNHHPRGKGGYSKKAAKKKKKKRNRYF